MYLMFRLSEKRQSVKRKEHTDNKAEFPSTARIMNGRSWARSGRSGAASLKGISLEEVLVARKDDPRRERPRTSGPH